MRPSTSWRTWCSASTLRYRNAECRYWYGSKSPTTQPRSSTTPPSLPILLILARSNPRGNRVTLAAAGNVGGQRSRWLVRRITSLTSELRQPAGEYHTHHSRHLKHTPRAARLGSKLLEERGAPEPRLRPRGALRERVWCETMRGEPGP